jgi:SepF-like predicted cell division protein (DUF552 family)
MVVLESKNKETLNCRSIDIKGLREKMPFNLFRKKKQPEQNTPSTPIQEEPKQEPLTPTQEEPKQEPLTPTQEEPKQEPAVASQEPVQENTLPTIEEKPETIESLPEQKQEPVVEAPSKTYLKAMPLKEITDIENIKNEVKNGNIIILRVTPLATKSIEDVKNAVNELYQFTESIGGDIARLGEERVVICPKTIRIWREKSPAPISNEALPKVA